MEMCQTERQIEETGAVDDSLTYLAVIPASLRSIQFIEGLQPPKD